MTPRQLRDWRRARHAEPQLRRPGALERGRGGGDETGGGVLEGQAGVDSFDFGGQDGVTCEVRKGHKGDWGMIDVASAVTSCSPVWSRLMALFGRCN